jgi:hypothetical protein
MSPRPPPPPPPTPIASPGCADVRTSIPTHPRSLPHPRPSPRGPTSPPPHRRAPAARASCRTSSGPTPRPPARARPAGERSCGMAGVVGRLGVGGEMAGRFRRPGRARDERHRHAVDRTIASRWPPRWSARQRGWRAGARCIAAYCKARGGGGGRARGGRRRGLGCGVCYACARSHSADTEPAWRGVWAQAAARWRA